MKNRSPLLSILFIGILCTCALSFGTHADMSASHPINGFSVTGAVDSSGVWTVARLQQTFANQIQTLNYTLKGVKHTAHVVPLEAIVDAAHPRLNPQVKNAILRGTVTVTGQDGYAATFSMGELSPDFGHEDVWVAIDQDGKPLATRDGPVELIVPADAEPGRWVHAIASIKISTTT